MSCSKAINKLLTIRIIVIKLAVVTIALLILCAQRTVSELITKIEHKGKFCVIDTIFPSTDRRYNAFQMMMTTDFIFRGTVF